MRSSRDNLISVTEEIIKAIKLKTDDVNIGNIVVLPATDDVKLAKHYPVFLIKPFFQRQINFITHDAKSVVFALPHSLFGSVKPVHSNKIAEEYILNFAPPPSQCPDCSINCI